MSVYTLLRLHPRQSLNPSEALVRKLLSEMGIARIDIASGSNPDPFWTRMRKKWLPRLVETAGGQSVFFEKNLDLNEAIQLWQTRPCRNVHFCLAAEGWSTRVNAECEQLIPSSPLANNFVPWDCGLAIGPWAAHDYDTGQVIASGNFSISKSYNGCPIHLREYENAFAKLPSVASMIAFFQSQTNSPWTVTCELT